MEDLSDLKSLTDFIDWLRSHWRTHNCLQVLFLSQ
jgi:hypothetical protein